MSGLSVKAGLLVAAIAVFNFGGNAAVAAVAERALQDYDAGRFLSAAATARQSGTAEGLAFAARAELAHADMLASKAARAGIIARAEEDARAAIALAPDASEPRLQLAIALGFKGRLDGQVLAHIEGYADEARAHLDIVLAREPDNPWAHALLGGWHLEIVGLGGFLGRALYGAEIEAGSASYERALSLRPGDPVISYQWALQLASIEEQAYSAQAIDVLSRASGRTSSRFLDERTRARIAELDAALRADDREQIRTLIKRHRWALDGAGEAPSRINLRPATDSPR